MSPQKSPAYFAANIPDATLLAADLEVAAVIAFRYDGGMKELSEEEVQLVIRALDHYYAYLVATQREDRRYPELAERLRRKRPSREEPQRAG